VRIGKITTKNSNKTGRSGKEEKKNKDQFPPEKVKASKIQGSDHEWGGRKKKNCWSTRGEEAGKKIKKQPVSRGLLEPRLTIGKGFTLPYSKKSTRSTRSEPIEGLPKNFQKLGAAAIYVARRKEGEGGQLRAR